MLRKNLIIYSQQWHSMNAERLGEITRAKYILVFYMGNMWA